MKIHRFKSSRFLKLLLLLLAPLAITLSANAVTRSWTGTTSSTWTTAANWGGTAPTNSISTDIAKFSTTTSGRMPNVAGTRSINGLIFDTRDWSVTNSTVDGVLSVGGSGINIQSQRTVTLETLIATNGGSWITNGSAILNVNQAVTEIAGGPYTLTKAGGGTMNLNANVSVGTLSLTGGFTVLGADNLLVDSMHLNGNGANLNLNGHSDELATLTIGASDLALNFGAAAGANSISFTDSSAVAWGAGTLLIQNFEAGTDTLRFGTNNSSLTPAQLAKIQFGAGPAGAVIDSNGYVTQKTIFTWTGATSSTFSVGTNWDGGAPPDNSLTSRKAQFSSTTLGRMPMLDANRSINGLVFDSRDWTLDGGINLLSIGTGGIEIQSQRTVTLGTAIAVLTQSWTTSGSAVLNVNRPVSEIANGPYTLTKAGGGTMNLNHSLTVGTLSLTGGATVLGADDLLDDSMNLIGSGANLNLNGYSDELATLNVGAGDLAINFGAAVGANSISFAGSSSETWGAGILLVQNFEAGTDTLRFGTSASGLSPAQLAKIQFGAGPAGAQINSLGYVTPLAGDAYSTWAGGSFANPFPVDQRGAEVDFDNDGLGNLLEFVLGGDPTISQDGVRPTVTAAYSNLIVTFKRSDASETQPVTVKVQVSADLVTWNPADDITIGAGDGSGPNGATYTVDDTGDLDIIVVTIPKNSAVKKFARVIAIQ
jgi:hypothetical protein